jgi:hypothetical protein
MKKDSPEHKKFKAEYEAKERYKKEHPEEYPWWAYFQYGWHNITHLTDEEMREVVEFYHLIEGHTEDGRRKFFRFGRQPITIIRREEAPET